MVREIKEIEDPRTGTKLAKEVYRREEIYSGEYVDGAPDIVMLTMEGYLVGDSPGSREVWNYLAQSWYRAHKLHGIFLARGPDIREGVEIQGTRICDLASTILHIFGIPIRKDMDGRMLKENI